MAYSVVCSDSFNRANGSIAGSTLDNANGGSETDTWTVVSGSWLIVSNALTVPASGYAAVLSTAAVGDSRVSAKFNEPADSAVLIRFASTGSYYGAFVLGSPAKVSLYLNGATLLGTAGTTTIVVGDTITLEAVGTTFNVYINGVLELSRTDSSHATGKPGLYGGGLNLSGFDDFKFELPSNTITIPTLNVRQAVTRASFF